MEMEEMEEEEEEERLPDEDEDETAEVSEGQLEAVLELFKKRDMILEPSVFGSLSLYFRLGGSPGPVVELLSAGYAGQAQLGNVMGEWLVGAGEETGSVAAVFESALAALLTKHFNSKKADAIFEQADNSGIEWLPHLIAHGRWRALVYALADAYPDCLMLNFAVKLISDAGFQHEISSVTTAAQQLEIFSRVLTSAVDATLSQIPHSSAFQEAFAELVRVACHSEYTYLYTASLLQVLSCGESGGRRGSVLHLAGLLKEAVAGRVPGLKLPESLGAGQETSEISLALATGGRGNPALHTAMHSMLSKGALNPADVTLLYDFYRQSTPPPVSLIRQSDFLSLLIAALFSPGGALSEQHKHKYVYLLSYASTVGSSPSAATAEVAAVADAVESMSELCQGRGDTGTELLLRLPVVFAELRVPVVAAGLLHWVRATLAEPNYFQLHPEPVPIHLALIDEIGSQHPLLHPQVFGLLKWLMEWVGGGGEGLGEARSAGQMALERSRTFVDRLVHLLWNGFVIPVAQFMAKLYADGAADTSLIRYFVTETLDVIGPPYSKELKEALLPLVNSPEIVDASVLDKVPAVAVFIEHISQTA